MNNNFSEKLKKLRKDAGVTQQSLADAIGEKRSSIANYESNNSLPGFEILNKLSSFFNVPVGYLTGQTNSLVSEYTFKTLEDYINITPDIKPLWLRISNPVKYKSFKEFEVYGPTEKTKIEFFNPLEQKKKNNSSRIYIEFLNIASSTFMNKEVLYKSVYSFLTDYGFLGDLSGISSEENKQYFTLLKPHEFAIMDTVYYNPALYQFDLLYKSAEYPYKDRFSEVLNHYGIIGYFEPIQSVIDCISEMDRLVRPLADDEALISSTLEQISYHTSGIRKRFVETDTGEIVESIGYRNLLSLMYYELFLDIKSGNIPQYCYECHKYYLPDEKHKCK